MNKQKREDRDKSLHNRECGVCPKTKKHKKKIQGQDKRKQHCHRRRAIGGYPSRDCLHILFCFVLEGSSWAATASAYILHVCARPARSMCVSSWSLKNCFDAWCKRIERRFIFGLDSTGTKIYTTGAMQALFLFTWASWLILRCLSMTEAFCHYSVSTGWSLFWHFEMLGSVIFFMG